MPLRALAGTAVEPDPVVVVHPVVPPLSIGTVALSWIPAGGEEYVLTPGSGSIRLRHGVDGLDMPPQEQARSPRMRGGSTLHNKRWASRPVMLPVVLQGGNEMELTEARRQLVRMFNPMSSEGGELVVAQPDGSRRRITLIYDSGLESPLAGHWGPTPLVHRYDIVLNADDPLFYGDEKKVPFPPPEGVDFFPTPGSADFLTISSSTTMGDLDLEIDGEEDAWPTWFLTGPMTTVLLRNRDTGLQLYLTANLAAGQTLVIRTDATDPAMRITDGAGNNRWAQTAGQFPNLWPLAPGMNRVTVTAQGTGIGSNVLLTYRPRYLTS